MVQFKLIFDGEALTNHEINPRDLSIALLAIDSLLKEANQAINHGRIRAQVSVKGSFETGSFTINLVFSLIDQIKDLFDLYNNNDSIINPKTILGSMFGIGAYCSKGHKCLVYIIKFLKGSRPDKIFENDDGSLTIIKDGCEITSEKKTYELYRNYKLRKSFEDLVSPVLSNSGISDVAIKHNNDDENFCMITKEEASFFACPEVQEEKMDTQACFETNISIINLSFKEGNKWYVNDGQSSFYVTVEDDEFLKRIDNRNIAFAKGDILKVRIRREQFINIQESKLKTENFIEQVMNYTVPSTQLPLIEEHV